MFLRSLSAQVLVQLRQPPRMLVIGSLEKLDRLCRAYDGGAAEHFGGLAGLREAGGYLGLATAVAAWYASFAVVTNKTFGRIVLPVKELKK